MVPCISGSSHAIVEGPTFRAASPAAGAPGVPLEDMAPVHLIATAQGDAVTDVNFPDEPTDENSGSYTLNKESDSFDTSIDESSDFRGKTSVYSDSNTSTDESSYSKSTSEYLPDEVTDVESSYTLNTESDSSYTSMDDSSRTYSVPKAGRSSSYGSSTDESTQMVKNVAKRRKGNHLSTLYSSSKHQDYTDSFKSVDSKLESYRESLSGSSYYSRNDSPSSTYYYPKMSCYYGSRIFKRKRHHCS
ncbi:unnamed protein product [Calypogeia fissa]